MQLRRQRWQRLLDVNLTGIFATLRAAARIMKPQRSGRLILTTSVAAYQCEPAIGAAYMAAKAGAAHLMHCVAQELAAYNITVNAIAPGFFVTNIGGGHARNPQVQSAMAKRIPMHRVGFPDDIKGLALFLASPASAYLTGQQISIDGGWALGVADQAGSTHTSTSVGWVAAKARSSRRIQIRAALHPLRGNTPWLCARAQ